jgi:hypothetical protein
VKISAAGDRYRMDLGSVPLPGFSMTSEGTTTGFLRSPGEGRWVVEELTLPARMNVTIGDDKASVFAFRIGEQKARMEIDTTLASPSKFEWQYGNVEYTSKGGPGSAVTRMTKVTMTSLLTPGADGRMKATGESRVSGFDQKQNLPDGSMVALKAREIVATSHGEGLSPPRFDATVRTAAQLASDVQSNPRPDGGPSPAQRKMLHALLEHVTDLFSSLETEQTWSGVSLAAEGMTGSLVKVKLGNTMGAPEGKAEFGMKLELEGFASPMLPKGGISDLVPKRLALAPRVSGVKKADMVALLSRAIDTVGDDDADVAGDAMHLLAGNPAVISLDTFDLDIGGARLRGTGAVNVASPEDVTGAGELRMTGLDALMRSVAKVPEAAMAAPVLLMLKGLGEQKGAETVWRLTYAENKLLVNGQDVSALMAGAK